MSTHMDQMNAWWESAEEGDPRDGDIIIEWAGDGHAVRTFYESERKELFAACTYRILSRASKPEPAWHNAVAVIASNVNTERQVWERYMGTWCGTAGDEADSEDLTDVVPLIEAKVTDEARDRVWEELVHHGLINPEKHRPSQGWTGDVVHVALGLPTDPA